MNNLFKVMAMVLVAGALLLISCNPEEESNNCNTGNTTTVAAPTHLDAFQVTPNTAKLTWQSTENQFEITVNGKTSTVEGRIYYAGGLTPESQYTWSLRAKKGSEMSDAVTSSFSTPGFPPSDE